MGKAARRKEQRRVERAYAPQSAQGTQSAQSAQSAQQPLVVSYNKLRHAISWADLSTASVETVPTQPAANDAVIEAPTAPAVKQRKKPGPKPKPVAPEVRQAQLWALYADLWDLMEEDLSDKERRALQRAMARNSGELDTLIEQDDTEDFPESRRAVSLLDDDEEYIDEEEIDYSDFFEDFDKNY